jgi:rhodanese-related sulfurtransferase
MDSSLRPDGDEIAVGHVTELVEQGAVLLDVREPYEWDAGHAPQAVHIPMGMLTLDGLPAGRPLLVVCHLGARSAAVVDALRRADVEALNIRGGMAAWATAGLPVVTDTGAPGSVV